MALEILKSFSHLQTELEQAKSSLKGVDENIKRLIGRDPSDIPPRPGQKRPLDDKNSRQPFSKFSRGFQNDDTSKRRNPNAVSVFKRLSDKVPDESFKSSSRGIISKVIPAPKEVPSRQAVLDKQNKDEKFKARNRRMFGALLGTLQRFQQDESKQKKREEKRTQIEKKIDEHEQQEKDEVKKERQELFLNRKKKQQEIKAIELKMLRMKEYAAWEQAQKPRASFIVTKAKPHIHYLPRKLDDKSKQLLEKSKKDVEEQIEKRRQEVSEELNHIQERMTRSFDNERMTRSFDNNKNPVEPKEDKTTDRHDRHGSESEEDDGDIKMKSLSPDPQEEKEENSKKDEVIDAIVKEESTSVTTENSHYGPKEEKSELQDSKNENDNIVPETIFENNLQCEPSTVNDLYDNIDSNNMSESAQAETNGINMQSQNSEVSNFNVVLTNNENVTQEVVPENI